MPCGLTFASTAPERSGAGFFPVGSVLKRPSFRGRNWHPASQFSKLGRFPGF
jgi:hypothetical protein